MYGDFASAFRKCWACGWRQGWRSWCLSNLEIAHIVGGAGRRHDRRAIVRLCNGCHLLNHGARIVVAGVRLPTLDLGHLVWLKREWDQEHLDIPYLMSLRVKRAEVIEPVELPEWFLVQRSN